jgi:hypothetical protein
MRRSQSMNPIHINEMYRCVDLDTRKPRRKRYRTSRNHVMFTASSPVWDELAGLGYAECRLEADPGYHPKKSVYIYRLTEAGLDLVGAMVRARIEVTGQRW